MAKQHSTNPRLESLQSLNRQELTLRVLELELEVVELEASLCTTKYAESGETKLLAIGGVLAFIYTIVWTFSRKHTYDMLAEWLDISSAIIFFVGLISGIYLWASHKARNDAGVLREKDANHYRWSEIHERKEEIKNLKRGES